MEPNRRAFLRGSAMGLLAFQAAFKRHSAVAATWTGLALWVEADKLSGDPPIP